MKFCKGKIVGILITPCMVLALLCMPIIQVLAADAPNLDSASTWARERIQEAFDKGFIPTDLQSNYSNVITREEFCRMAAKWMEFVMGKSITDIVTERGIAERMGHTFSDTSDSIILAAYRLGVTNGTTAPTATAPGIFNPSGAFDRQQAATMIMNVCKALGANVDNLPNSDFVDLNTAASWARDGINFVRVNEIMSGTSTTTPTFSPLTNYTRQESIITFNNIDPERIGIGNSNPQVELSFTGIWELLRIDSSGVTVLESEYVLLFPAGLPFLFFNEDNTVELVNFNVDYVSYDDTYVGSIEHCTFSHNGSSITITSSEGNSVIFTYSDEVLSMQKNGVTMQFIGQVASEE